MPYPDPPQLDRVHFSLVHPPYLQAGNRPCADCHDPANAGSPACGVFR